MGSTLLARPGSNPAPGGCQHTPNPLLEAGLCRRPEWLAPVSLTCPRQFWALVWSIPSRLSRTQQSWPNRQDELRVSIIGFQTEFGGREAQPRLVIKSGDPKPVLFILLCDLTPTPCPVLAPMSVYNSRTFIPELQGGLT